MQHLEDELAGVGLAVGPLPGRSTFLADTLTSFLPSQSFPTLGSSLGLLDGLPTLKGTSPFFRETYQLGSVTSVLILFSGLLATPPS